MAQAAIKRFGPVKGPGVGIIEKTSGRSIEAGELGGAAFIGQFRRGAINTITDPKYNDCASKNSFLKKMGGRFDAISMAPDAALDYWDLSGGAGRVYAIRVTDGTEKTASVTLFSRHWGTAFGAAQSLTDTQTQVKQAVLKIAAKNGGRWAGRRRILDGDVPIDIATNVAETTLDIGQAAATAVSLKKDEFKGALVAFEGVASRTYEVTTNTAAGVFTVATGSTMKTDFAGGTNKHYTVTLSPRALTTGKKEGLAVRVKSSNLDPANEFGLEVWVDGQIAGDYDSVSMDPASVRYVKTVVEASDANDEIAVTDLLASGTAIVPDLRPASYYVTPTAATATQLTFPLANIFSASDSKIKVVSISKAGVDPVPHRLTFTFVAAGDKYTVAASQGLPGVDLRNLPDFVMAGDGEQLHQIYDPGKRPSIKVVVDHTGGEPADGATLIIDVLPLPKFGSAVDNDAVGWDIFPDAKGKPFTSLLASEVDFDTVKIAAGDFTTVAAATAAGATVTSGKAQTYSIQNDVSDKILLSIDGGADVTIDLTAGGAQSAQQVCNDINAAMAAQLGYHCARPDADNKVQIFSLAGAKKGSSSSIQFKTVANSAYTILGLTVGTTVGVDGLAPSKAALTSSLVQTYNIGAGASDKMLISVDGRKDVTVTLTDGGARTAAQIVTDINTAFDAVFGAENLNPASATSDNRVNLASTWHEGGVLSSIQIKAVVNDAYAVLGFVAGTVRGFWGSECMVSFPASCAGGYDGDTPKDQAYVDALDIVSSPANKLEGKGRGVLQVACPGKTSTTITKQLIAYVENKNHFGSYEIPDTITTEQGAIDHVNTTVGRSDHVACYFPSFVSVVDSDKEGPLKTVSVLGMVFGLDAAQARTVQGYFLPAAGTGAKMPKIVKLATGDKVLNEELLTPQGLNVIKFKGADAIIWGARTANKSTDFQFKAHRLQFSHYEHAFVDNFDDVIFGLNTQSERNRLIARVRDFFRKEFKKGALDGATLEDAVTIKADAENNTAASVAAGDMNMEIALALPGIAERLLLAISKAGIFEGTAT